MKKDRVVTFFVTVTLPEKATIKDAYTYLQHAINSYSSFEFGSVKVKRPRTVTQQVIILPPKGR